MSRRTRLEHAPPVLPLRLVRIVPPAPKPEKVIVERRWMWNVDGKGGIVTANTKSEAKSRAKTQLGLRGKKRFPQHGVITEITNESEPIVSRTAQPSKARA